MANSAQVLRDLQNKVVQLEAKLNILSDWISQKFADDHSLPSELLSKPSQLSHSMDCQSQNETSSATNHSTVTVRSSNNELEAASRPNRRKQKFSSFRAPVFEKIPFNSEIKDEQEDVDPTIRIVDMSKILDAIDNETRLSSSRTRQPYACTTCNRKFRTLDMLQNHEMTHCFVQITSLDSIKIKKFQQEDKPEERDGEELTRSNSDNEDRDNEEDVDFQPYQDDTESLDSDPESFTSPGPSKEKTRRVIRHREIRKNRADKRRKICSLVCSVCQKKYAYKQNLNQHMKLVHRKVYEELERNRAPEDKVEMHSCHICEKQYSKNYLLKRHRIKLHPEECKREIELKKARKAILGPVHRCTICKDGELFKTRTVLNKHKTEVHNIPLQKPKRKLPEVRPICHECNITFTTTGTLVQHNRFVHLKIKPFVCAQCGKTFAKRYRLDSHMDLHSDRKQYSCQHCQKSFQQREGLRIHMKRHFKSKNNIQCSQCGQFFVNSQTLKKHVLSVHEGIRAHGCPQCDKRFKTKIHLNYHLKTHENANGRKRGLNKEREPLPKRKPNRQEVLVVESNSDDTVLALQDTEAVDQ